MECGEFHTQSRNQGQREASCVHLFMKHDKCRYWNSYKTHHIHLPPVPRLPPEATCMLVWSSGQNATAATRSRRPMLPRASATWNVKERRATCVGEPTGCPSTGWSWARSRHAAVSLTPLQRRLQRDPSRVLKENACWDYQMRLIFPEPPLFDSGLMPQLRAGFCAVFTSAAVFTLCPSREPCYLHNPASCGLHSKHSPPAAAKLKAGPMIRDERVLCAEAACIKNAATQAALLDFHC